MGMSDQLNKLIRKEFKSTIDAIFTAGREKYSLYRNGGGKVHG